MREGWGGDSDSDAFRGKILRGGPGSSSEASGTQVPLWLNGVQGVGPTQHLPSP